MALLGQRFPDIIDALKVGDPKAGAIIEMLKEKNPVMEDAISQPCSHGSSHKHKVRTGIPEAAFGRLYKGTVQGKSTYAQVTDVTGSIEGRSELDVRMMKKGLGADKIAALRLAEADGHMQAISNTHQETFFYGNSDTDPDKFDGLSPRFSDLSAKNGSQIINAGGSGSDNTSIWFVPWGDNYCHLIHPDDASYGITRDDKGEQQVNDDDGNPYFALVETFSFDSGVAVKDWRNVARIANIDVSDALAGTVDLFKFMRQAYHKLENPEDPSARFAIYMNRNMAEVLDMLQTNAGNGDNFVRLRPMEIEGKTVTSYRNMPIRITQALLNTEAEVV